MSDASANSDDTVVRPARFPRPPGARRRAPSAPRWWRKGPIIGAAVLLVVVLAWGVGYLSTGDTLPRHAQIAGVAVGGLSRLAATAKLSAELGPRAAQPMAVTVAGRAAEVSPAEAGLGVDYPASVAAAGGRRTLDPRTILRVLAGGGPTDAVVSADPVRLRAVVQRLAGTVDRPAVDAQIRYAGTKVRRTAALAGVSLQQEPAAAALQAAFLRHAGPLELPVGTADPMVSTAEADQVVSTFAKPAVSAPVVVEASGGSTFTVTPKVIAGALTFEPRDGTLAPRLDAAKLRDLAEPAIGKVVLAKPRNATVRLVKGRPKVIPAVDGTGVAAEALAAAVEPALPRSGDGRRVQVALTGAKASFSTADAEQLGVKKVIGKFTTYFPYLPYRNINIGRAAELINGTLLMPGDTFSLNKVVGERTRANGFTEGFIIKDSKFTKELGGGVSQSATTTYNAMFFAGLKDVQHQPHSLYINRYPAGREATVAWPSVDLKFADDTRYGVLVQASIVKGTPARQGSITVKMWSTKTYDKVTSTTPVRSNFTTGRTVKDSSAGCEPTSPVPGFDANYQRWFYLHGKVVKRQRFHWRYAPTNHIVCVKKK